MFNLNIKSQVDTTPWEIPLSKRISYLKGIIASDQKVAIHIYEFPDNSTFRYRAYNIYQHLIQSSKWKSIYFFQSELSYLLPFLEGVALAVICRVRWSLSIDNFIARCNVLNIPIVFDVDDLVFDLEYLPLLTNTLNVPLDSDPHVHYDFWFACTSRIGYTASKSDYFTSTNRFLCNMLEEKYQKPAYIIPNTLNTEQISISKLCVEQKDTLPNKSPFIVGYFSGTPSHINDFKIAHKALVRFLEDFSDTMLQVVGYMDFPSSFIPFIEEDRVKFVDFVDFVELQRLVASVDVNIVPLVNNTFTNCKSELKFFESAIVDTITLATPIYSYAHSIQDGVTGYLCEENEWYSKLKNVYLNYEEQKSIVSNARKYALSHYYGSHIVTTIENCYQNIYDVHHTL